MVSEGQEGERSELEKPLRQVEAEEALRQAREMSDALNCINTVFRCLLIHKITYRSHYQLTTHARPLVETGRSN